jgi:hypothetical protein
MPIGNSYKQNDACKLFRLSLLGDEISLNIKDSQSRKNKHAHSSTSSGLDLDHPFSRVAGHGRLGGNHRSNGRGGTLGLCVDCGRAAYKPIGSWRRADLDGSRASPLLADGWR